MKTHWSRSEILNLSRAEFDFYTDEILKATDPVIK